MFDSCVFRFASQVELHKPLSKASHVSPNSFSIQTSRQEGSGLAQSLQLSVLILIAQGAPVL